MNTLVDEIYEKLNGKYSKEKITYICNNFFLIMNNLIKAQLVSSIYISSFGSFFLSTALIQRKINLWKRKKLDHSEYDKFLELSR
ncbi:MAG: hypothetical protein ACRCYT_02035, partial [Cetobacterium sp.]